MTVRILTPDTHRPTPATRQALWVAGQTAVVLTGVFVYFRVRHLTEGASDVARAHAEGIFALEQRLHLAWEGDLQELLAPSNTLQMLANWVYIWGHWPVIVVTMAWLVSRHRTTFLRLRDAMLVSGALGLVVFATYPVMPPRLAGLGLEDTVTEQSQSYRVLQPPGFVDQYAALPSLHVGWDLLIGMAIFSATGALTLKVVGVLMPVLMTIAVVATANHYVLDVVAGVVFVLVGHAAALLFERRRGPARPAGGRQG